MKNAAVKVASYTKTTKKKTLRTCAGESVANQSRPFYVPVLKCHL